MVLQAVCLALLEPALTLGSTAAQHIHQQRRDISNVGTRLAANAVADCPASYRL